MSGAKPEQPKSFSLHHGSFTVSAAISLRGQDFGIASAIPVGIGAVVLCLFAPDNPEILVKVLDGREINGHWWVQIASVTQMNVEVTVAETATGRANTYRATEGPFTPVADFTAFDCPTEDEAHR